MGTTNLDALTLSGDLTAEHIPQIKIASAANAYCGKKRYTGTVGTGKISIPTTAVRSSSRILLTAQCPLFSAKTRCNLQTIASGASFSVKLTYGQIPTGATGTVHWMIVNV